MSCAGCVGAVQRILSKQKGVTSVDANLETQRVDVSTDGSVEVSALVEALKPWATASGKSVEPLV